MLASLLGQGGSQLIRLVSNLILSRLLFPEAFGLMALVWMVVSALEMISDVGVRPSVVQHDRGDEEHFLATAWSVQIVRGALLSTACLALSFPFARFYEEPALASLVAVGGLTSLISGFESTKLLSLSRRLRLERVVAIEVTSQLASLAATVSWAWFDRSVWALVGGALVGRVARVLLSHVSIPGRRDHLGWDAAAARDIVGFGKWILLSTLITFLATRLDVMMLGKLLPMATLGVYSIGVMVAQVPATVASRVARAVLLPVLAAARRRGGEHFTRELALARRLCLPAGAAAVVGGVAVSPIFFQALYDPRYHDAGWISQLSMLPFWFTFLQFATRSALEATGISRPLALGNGVKLAVTAAGVVVGFQLGGLPGVIVGLGFGSLCGYATIAAALPLARGATLRDDALATAATLGVAAAVGLGGRALGNAAFAGDVAIATAVAGVPVAAAISLWAVGKVRRSGRAA